MNLALLRRLAAGWVLLGASLAWAQQAVPALTAQVVDNAHVLDASQAASVTQQLAALEQRTGAQVAVLTVDSTLPEDIADYTQRVADEWKLGRAKVGDGVLIVVAVKDRRARIAVAKTLEGAIPDLEARRIITQAMAPKFQSGDYAGGLQAGIARLAALIQGEGLPTPASDNGQGAAQDGAPWWVPALMGLFVLSNVLRAFLGRRGSALLTGAAAGVVTMLTTGSWILGLAAALVAALFALLFGAASLLRGLGSGGRTSGPVIFGSGWPGGRGGGGGGWHSGGGGDFGGGGASGRW
jgi:uncharacterized protein